VVNLDQGIDRTYRENTRHRRLAEVAFDVFTGTDFAASASTQVSWQREL